jgi:hypothetical protein
MEVKTRTVGPWLSVLYGLGLMAVFVGERMIGSGTPRIVATVLGLLLLAGSIGLRAVSVGSAPEDRKGVQRRLLALSLVGVVALLLYFVQSDVITRFTLKPLERDFPRVAVILAALWPIAILASVVPMALVEMSYAQVARAPRLELRRIREAMYAGLGLAGALTFAFTAVYVCTQRDKKLDLSYFRTAKPGEATRKIVRALSQPVQVALFFPPANEVADQAAGYFDDLHKESPMLEVARYDQAVDVAKAKELGVSGNGSIVVSRQGRRETINLGLELEQARNQLRTMDKEAQKKILQVSKTGRTFYLTQGHGERTFDKAEESDKRGTIKALKEILTDQGYLVRTLTAVEGLASEIPKDAGVVGVIGPQKAFLPEEVAALTKYMEGGGRMLVAVDPEAGIDHKDLLAPLGVEFKTTQLANDQVYARRSNQVSDRANIVTGLYSSHPAVTTIGRLHAPTAFAGSGWLEERKDRNKELSLDFTIRSHNATWNDANNNFTFDPPAESRKSWDIAAAVQHKGKDKDAKESRALVFADSDALTDGLLPHPQLGNAYLVLDGVKWLVGDEGITGEITNEADVSINHTRKQDVAWFYSSVFLAPGLVLLAGWLATRRGRASRKAAKLALDTKDSEQPKQEVA